MKKIIKRDTTTEVSTSNGTNPNINYTIVEGRRVWNKNIFIEKQEAYEKESVELEDSTFKTDEHRKLRVIKPLEARKEILDLKLYQGKKVSILSTIDPKRTEHGAFACQLCNVAFTDSSSFIDHKNTKEHLSKEGMTSTPLRASLDDVKRKLAMAKLEKSAKSDKKACS